MKYVLLTGAGFTRNWGGWLARELEGDLLSRVSLNPALRALLQHSRGFEDALETLQREAAAGDADSRGRYTGLQTAVAQSFRAMNLALADPSFRFNFSQQGTFSVSSFLSRFDAIYTLNQDLLLELHYDPALEEGRKWNGIQFPGVRAVVERTLFKTDRVDQKRHVLNGMEIHHGTQPIFKLHGSVDWTDDSGDLFVVGGGKKDYIERKPLLSAYFKEFAQRLRSSPTRLMIIGYGFADQHVNDVLTESYECNRDLSIYFVHPEGRDAIHCGAQRSLPQWIPPLGYIPCIGESRRPLWSTFKDDALEHQKLLRFFS